MCTEFGLTEHVAAPTRGPYLLDLVLSDLDSIDVEVPPGIIDHSMVLCCARWSLPLTTAVQRECFFYNEADWAGLTFALQEVDWSLLLEGGDAEAAATVVVVVVTFAFAASGRHRLPVVLLSLRTTNLAALYAVAPEANAIIFKSFDLVEGHQHQRAVLGQLNDIVFLIELLGRVNKLLCVPAQEGNTM